MPRLATLPKLPHMPVTIVFLLVICNFSSSQLKYLVLSEAPPCFSISSCSFHLRHLLISNSRCPFHSPLYSWSSTIHSESTLQSFVTFSQKPQTENRKLSVFVCFCAITRWFLKLTVAFVTICVILDESTGLIPCYLLWSDCAKF